MSQHAPTIETAIQIADEVRRLLEPHWLASHKRQRFPEGIPTSTGHCPESSYVLMKALHDRGIPAVVESGDFRKFYGDTMLTTSSHVWVRLCQEGVILDITSDQFENESTINVAEETDRRYYSTHRNPEHPYVTSPWAAGTPQRPVARAGRAAWLQRELLRQPSLQAITNLIKHYRGKEELDPAMINPAAPSPAEELQR